MREPLLKAAISVEYAGRGQVLKNLRLAIDYGEIFGLAGQSGCGKSTFSMAVLRLLDRQRSQTKGSIYFEGVDLLTLPEKSMRRLRGAKIALVPQSPLAALNPRMRLGAHFRETWLTHKPGDGGWREATCEFLEAVSLPASQDFLRKYPRELSVGMAQRVLIALAVMLRPRLVIADEATSALDLLTQADILRLFTRLNKDYGVSVLFIAHDLLAAGEICHRMGILQEGCLVECGPTGEVFGRPKNAYTRKLLAALPKARITTEPVSEMIGLNAALNKVPEGSPAGQLAT